jgi:hypothetical protein
MSDTFFEKSKAIANDFIQSVVFLDDKAYKGKDKENPNHDFDALKITQAFAKENKICAVYNPESDSDVENFKFIANKSDVVILDWQIVFQSNFEDGSEEEDAPDDPRGIYTLAILKYILEDVSKNKEGLKLIVVYTGETNLNEITDKIFAELYLIKPDLKKESCQVCSSNVKILVRAKSSVEEDEEDNKFNHLVELKDKIVKYKDLPNFVLVEYTKMTSGLLSNFALMSLTTLRKNSSKIIGLFSNEMDSAYLGHKATIPKQEDAEDLLIELFGDSVKDLLFYFNINTELRENLIESWIDEKIIEEDYTIGTKTFKRTIQSVKNLIKSSEESIEQRFSLLDSTLSNSNKKDLVNKSTDLYTNLKNRIDSENMDKLFSKLTHHKSLFIPKNTEPKLSLGTLIKSNKNQIYYICIQQKCDSVRILKDEERKFLFIPLTVSDNKFDVLTPDGTKLKKNKNSFSIRTIKFVCPDNSGVIVATKEDDKFIFKQKYTSPEDEQFEWILDLKDLHSQRMIINYTSQLSRVGLDESEWHRKQLS